MITRSVQISAVSAFCSLGARLEDIQSAILGGRTSFRPLGGLFPDAPEAWANVPAAWSDDRDLLSGRKYAPASNLALLLARDALAQVDLAPGEIEEMALVVGSSRGNASGWLDPWPGRRPLKLMAASNSLHSELAAAVTIELGIRGPYHVLANGCSAGLDAIGFAALLISSGTVKRALAIGLDLPLSPTLLETYSRTGMMSENGVNDPYGAGASGLLPGEGGGAFLLEAGQGRGLAVSGWEVNSDAAHPIGMPSGAPQLARLLANAVSRSRELAGDGRDPHFCPHASGTPNNAQGETAAIRTLRMGGKSSLIALKPYVGHTIGASGALESAILCHFLKQGMLPPNLGSLTAPEVEFDFPKVVTEYDGRPVIKSAASMGGHNSVILFSGN